MRTDTVELGVPAASAPSPVAQGALLSERFLVEHWVSRGGMGDVYRGQDLSDRTEVAIKVMARFEAQDAKRFMREATVLAALSHPAIVPYVAHGYMPAGDPFLVMRWLRGRDLASRLTVAPLTAAETWLLARRACEGLWAAHARGIVHRDLKPSNLMLVGDDPAAVTLLDFGVARARARPDDGQPLTLTGAVLGTIGYMAPEQALGETDLDARVDVFALGCLIYECLTGRLAFGGRHTVAVLAKVLSAEPPSLAAHDARLGVFDPLLARLMARDRRARPSDAGEVLRLLDALRPSIWRLRRLTPGRVRAVVSAQERSWLSVLRCRCIEASWLAEPALARVERNARLLLGSSVEVQHPGASELALIVETQAGGTESVATVATVARFARSLRELSPGLCSVLVTGLTQVERRQAIHELIVQAGELMRADEMTPGQTLLDARSAEFLRARFALTPAGNRVLLEEPLLGDAPPRLLMGKRTPCVGRDKELSLLLATLVECKTDRVARSVLVTADAGMGKTRLASELQQRAGALTDARVLSARGDAMAVGSALGLVQQLIMSGLGLRAFASSRERQEQCVRCFGEPAASHVPDPCSLFLAELAGAPFADADERLLRAARNDPAMMSEQKRRAFVRFILALSAQAPLLIMIDDLHWGDLASVSFLDDALREACDRSIMVCAFARPEVHDLFPNIWTAHERQDIRLPRLTSRAAERLVRAVLGEDAPKTTVSRVIQLAEGNAFYIEELLRQVAQGSRELPESLIAIAHARLAQLPPEPRRVLRAASALGERFWGAAVQSLLPDVPDVAFELESLVRQELVRRSEESRVAGQVEYCFRHALLREAAYAMLTEQDRVAAHRCAGQWLQKQVDKDPDVLAQHFELGGEPLLAAAWLTRAARAALDAGDIVRVGTLARRALALGAVGIDRGELLALSAFACMYSERAQACWIEEALGLIPVGTAFWWLAVSLGIWSAATAGSPERAKPYIGLVLNAPAGAEPCGPHGQAVWLSVLGLISLKQTELAARIIERFEDVSVGDATSDLAFAGWVALARCTPGLTHPWSAQEQSGAIHQAERARRNMRDCGAVVGEVAALVYGAIATRNIGGYGAAENMLKHADVLLSHPMPQALREIVRVNQAWLALRSGRFAIAEPLIAEGCSSTDSPLALQALCLQAELHYRRGEFGSAIEVALRCTSSGYPTAERWGGATLARAHLALGQPEQGLAVADGVLRQETLGHEPDTQTDLQLSRALALSQLGKQAEANDVVFAVCARICETAAQFDDAHQRALFRYGIEAHARAAQLLAAWGLAEPSS